MLRVSVVIPTRDRPQHLSELLRTILAQTCYAFEVIVVDDSPSSSAEQVVKSLALDFQSISCVLRYIKGNDEGLPAARNLAVKAAKADAIMFLDDDVLLDTTCLHNLALFLENHPSVLGVQARVLSPSDQRSDGRLINPLAKLFMLSYRAGNRLTVRSSGWEAYPDNVEREMPVQRLSGCAMCYRHEVFDTFLFDTNLKSWGFMEDLDFSYRIHKRHPNSLFIVQNARVFHKLTPDARLATKTQIYMKTVHWFYFFFKDVFESSLWRLAAFLWAVLGSLLMGAGACVLRRQRRPQTWSFIHMLGAYHIAFAHLREIMRRDLQFLSPFLRKDKEDAKRTSLTSRRGI